MFNMTLSQLKVASRSGGVSAVTLRGEGGDFVVHIDTSNGDEAMLTKARGVEPRRFGNPVAALALLKEVGITSGRFDASQWRPGEGVGATRSDGRAVHLRQAHEAAAYAKALAADIQASIDDPRPSIPHDAAMAIIESRLSGTADANPPAESVSRPASKRTPVVNAKQRSTK